MIAMSDVRAGIEEELNTGPQKSLASCSIPGTDFKGILSQPRASPSDSPALQGGAPNRSQWPVFIIGAMRSGTTLLRYLTDSHERLACPPESKFIAAFQEMMDYPQVLKALLSLGCTPEEIRGNIRRFIDGIMDAYAERACKPRWVDKTPNYYKCLPFIDDIYLGQVLYLVMIRYPLDSIASLDEYFHPTANREDPDVARIIKLHGTGRYGWAKYWNEVYERIGWFSRSHPDRSHIIRYEDLVHETETCMHQVFNFIGEEPERADLSRALTMRHTPGYQDDRIRKTSRVHTKSVERWRKWKTEEALAIWDIVEPIASKFGYTAPGQEHYD